MGILFGFLPWIAYWILVGNVPFAAAALVALTAAAASLLVARLREATVRTLELGALATFTVLAVLTFSTGQAFMERWLQPLSILGIFAVSLTSALIGKPFIREFAAEGQSKEAISTDSFVRITATLTWIWVAAFGGMTMSSLIPPLARRDATILDTGAALSVVCYWVVPVSLLAIAALLSRLLPQRMAPPADEIIRKTTFVAFSEAEIDQLIYLATEHANREVGVGKEAYDVRIGGKGIPLVGDETRQSWPSTYKVRERKR
ncbi:hypothetical protein SBI67_17000 [Mycolicibacterium sp. 120266]|uniref:hypothetical protein n=1 Tax=Mycolicibacterium sp. 120266 TaxID=3090601 RepID=UPI00299D1FAF|nr:hypothetical protein [Mycolicibacterium sp. 120266]MDX1873820.1 hypothetical protein [Mycolicibacterium sp. 120266]